jgi:hypothetical protein
MTKYTCFSRFSVTKRCQKRGFNCWSWPIQQVWTPLHLISKTGHKWPWEADDWWRCSAGLAIELIKYGAEYYTKDWILRNFRYDFTFVFVFGLQTLFRWRCSFRRDNWLNNILGGTIRCVVNECPVYINLLHYTSLSLSGTRSQKANSNNKMKHIHLLTHSHTHSHTHLLT